MFTPVDVRLIGGNISREGRVEVFYQGSWGTVCDDLFDLDDADVVCRMLGYDRAGNVLPNAYFGEGMGDIVVDDLQCEGDELNIGRCAQNTFGSHNCSHNEDVGVTCISCEPVHEIFSVDLVFSVAKQSWK